MPGITFFNRDLRADGQDNADVPHPPTPQAVAINTFGSEETIQGSDNGPKRLAIRGWGYWGVVLLDIGLALIPVSFIVLSALCLSLHHHPKSPWGEKVKQAVLFSPTVFSIMYAAIMGKLLRRFGVYRAERGVRLKTLERLIGSQSVYSAIERQVGLRSIDLLGLSLIVLWSISPLGGQASLRLLTKEPRVVPINGTAQYFPIEGYAMSYLIGSNVAMTTWPIFAPVYMTALHMSKSYMNSSMDPWGAVRVPLISSTSGTTDGEWQHFDPTSPIEYTSLFGIPIVGVPTAGNVTFNMTSHYWGVECDQAVHEFADWNSTEAFQSYGKYTSILSFMLDMPDGEFAHPMEGMRFTYRSVRDHILEQNHGGKANISRIECSMRSNFAESRIGCRDRSCRVEALRKFERKKKPFPLHMIAQMMKLLPGTDVGMPQLRTGDLRTSTMTEMWIADPFKALDHGVYSGTFVDVGNLPAPVFSKRLQLVINSFWDATLGAKYRIPNFTLDDDFSMCTTNCISDPLYFNSTKLSGARFDGEHYVCSKPFAAITIVTSSIILLAAIGSLVLAAGLTTAPDILGYTSTYLRDNPYSEVRTASNLDGLDAARVYGNVRVMIGDVKSELDVGHVAFATAGAGVERLVKKRLYD
ncbi:uncharacterized protein EI97DRAFT_164893 [Westerdykella ornata]|uniref:Uncharacterized protein n=1 Tax=Westerdykella ornata TaxID=318751 RepID=A0A6A6JDG3_WESOR|nr:uncharacterized protein EI97DRAFT_164893 [Westerdykella ornata]KAF2273229.1 hypothetical protein EI97DRAFT_164893 [Westerdykella ornata]